MDVGSLRPLVDYLYLPMLTPNNSSGGTDVNVTGALHPSMFRCRAILNWLLALLERIDCCRLPAPDTARRPLIRFGFIFYTAPNSGPQSVPWSDTLLWCLGLPLLFVMFSSQLHADACRKQLIRSPQVPSSIQRDKHHIEFTHLITHIRRLPKRKKKKKVYNSTTSKNTGALTLH